MTLRPVVCDLSAIQSPDHRGRGVGRWAYELAAALEREVPELVGAYLLDPAWPPPGRVDDLLASGKLTYSGSPEAEAAVDEASVYLCLSPFELGRPMGAVRPAFVDERALAYAAIAYDLIPVRFAETYLEDPGRRRVYTARLEILRLADAVLAISSTAAADACELAGVESSRCHVVGTGVSTSFGPPASRDAVLDRLIDALPGLRGPFVLYPAGNDGRKNIDGLIGAFAEFARTGGSDHQLVIVGDLPPLTDNHFRHLARQAGIEQRVVLTGFVPDERLIELYQATELVVFPSFAEGYGLPIAEGLACGAVAAVSDRSPFDELVVDPRARFDPASTEDMARVIERCLRDGCVRESVRAGGATTVDRWSAVAARSAAVLERLAARAAPRAAARARRPIRPTRRLALISPFPPTRSGIARYSGSLVAAMTRVAAEPGAGRRGPGPDAPAIEIDCFADALDRYPATPDPVAGAAVHDARGWRGVDGAIGGYDAVVYVLGNSECHSSALAGLRERPGIVMTHDVRMSGLMQFSAERPGAVPGGLEVTIERAYDAMLPAGLGARGSLSAAEQDRFGLLLTRDVLVHTERLLVSSEAARLLAALDAGPGLSDRIGVLPFAVDQLNAADREAVERARAAHTEQNRSGLTIASFGIVDPAKRPDVLVEAVSLLVGSGHRVDLVLAGPVSEALEAELVDLAERLGIADRIELTGSISWERYLELLGWAGIAVQMRESFFGEASAAAAECLSAGVPTVVSDVGWLGDLPDDAVAKVARDCSASDLADRLAQLIDDRQEAAALANAGEHHARSVTFDDVAAALLDELGW